VDRSAGSYTLFSIQVPTIMNIQQVKQPDNTVEIGLGQFPAFKHAVLPPHPYSVYVIKNIWYGVFSAIVEFIRDVDVQYQGDRYTDGLHLNNSCALRPAGDKPNARATNVQIHSPTST